MALLRVGPLLSFLPILTRAQRPPLDEFQNATTYPNEQHANVAKYLHQAAELSSDASISEEQIFSYILQHGSAQGHGKKAGRRK